jgi:hypothetical protein
MAHDSPLPEPKTPMWLPALGAALFLAAAAWWLIRSQEAPKPPPAPEPAASSAPAGSAAPPADKH